MSLQTGLAAWNFFNIKWHNSWHKIISVTQKYHLSHTMYIFCSLTHIKKSVQSLTRKVSKVSKSEHISVDSAEIKKLAIITCSFQKRLPITQEKLLPDFFSSHMSFTYFWTSHIDSFWLSRGALLLSVNKDGFFLSNSCLSPTSCIALERSSHIMLTRNGDSGHLCLILLFKQKLLNIDQDPWSLLCFQRGSIMLRKFLPVPLWFFCVFEWFYNFITIFICIHKICLFLWLVCQITFFPQMLTNFVCTD